MRRSDRSGSVIGRYRLGARSRLDRMLRALMGDTVGEGLFVGALCGYMVFWQVGIVIVDTYAVANGLVALSNGRLAVETAVFGPGLETPGMHYVGSEHYARNYGQIVTALPFLWLLDSLDAVAELRVAIAAVWSLCLVWFARVLATVLDDRRVLTGGAVVALAMFGFNLRAPTPVPEGQTPLMALQIVSMLGAAFCGVVVYRLLVQTRSQRVAALAGGIVAFGTPIAFWATIPKRHTVTTALVLGVGYLLYRSRSVDRAEPVSPTSVRTGMYALVGLLAWVHAPIAVTLFIVLVAVDVPSAPSNGWRDVLRTAGGFVLSLIPFFLTNALISGNPLRPPRLLPAASSSTDRGSSSNPARDGNGDPSGETAGSQSADDSTLDVFGDVVDFGFSSVETVFGTYWDGVVTVVDEPVKLYHTFVVSTGDVPGVGPEMLAQASNLSMLEAGPILGAVAAVPVAIAGSRLQGDSWTALARPRDPTGILFLGFAVLLVLIYVPRLPLFGQITVRYLTPLYPTAVYGIFRYGQFGQVLAKRWWHCLYAYEATVLFGVPLFLAGVLWFGAGEFVAFEALSGVGLATGLVLFLGASSTGVTERFDREVAVLFGVSAGVATFFVTISLLVLYHYGVHQLPVVQEVTETVRYYLVRMTVGRSVGPLV